MVRRFMDVAVIDVDCTVGLEIAELSNGEESPELDTRETGRGLDLASHASWHS
jgi:hypothetical protein